MNIFLIILGSFLSICFILKILNNYVGGFKLKVPRTRYIYYQNKEYYYRIKGRSFLPFLGDIDGIIFRIKIYSVKRGLLGIPIKKYIYRSPRYYGSNNIFRFINNFKGILINSIDEYNNKDSEVGWDGCLDEISRVSRNRSKSIDTIVNE